jgi:transportin-3
MATKGSASEQAFVPVLTALATMRDGQREQKQAAHLFLEKFQKSVCYKEYCADPTSYEY